MKTLLVGIVLSYACAYGMENKNITSSHARASEKSGSTHIILKSNDDFQETLDKELLPEAWYRQIGEHKQECDQAGNPLITLHNVSSEVLPLVKNALYLIKLLPLIGSEHKQTKVAYTNFQALNLSLEKAAALLSS